MDKKRKNVRNNHDEIIKKMYKKSDNVRIKKDTKKMKNDG